MSRFLSGGTLLLFFNPPIDPLLFETPEVPTYFKDATDISELPGFSNYGSGYLKVFDAPEIPLFPP